MLFPPGLIIQHANTNSDIICSVSQRTVLLFSFVSNAVNYNVVLYSLVKLVVGGVAAQKIDNQLAKQSFPVLN